MDSVFGENGQSTAYDSAAEWQKKQDMTRSCMLHTKPQLQKYLIIV